MKTWFVALGGIALPIAGEGADGRKSIFFVILPVLARAGAWPVLIRGDCFYGNGPQVGLLALQNLGVERGRTVFAGCTGGGKPGMIGYICWRRA